MDLGSNNGSALAKDGGPYGFFRGGFFRGGFFAALQTEEGYVSFCVTEKRTKAEIDALVALVKEV